MASRCECQHANVNFPWHLIVSSSRTLCHHKFFPWGKEESNLFSSTFFWHEKCRKDFDDMNNLLEWTQLLNELSVSFRRQYVKTQRKITNVCFSAIVAWVAWVIAKWFIQTTFKFREMKDLWGWVDAQGRFSGDWRGASQALETVSRSWETGIKWISKLKKKQKKQGHCWDGGTVQKPVWLEPKIFPGN